ncbi:LacI family DNA-binding transcriptional regulator [Deinococcus sp. AJ005]|uniref:LacI family DNA-binding transcriptional regulator n=1 Tax=Deinococcus sp. AJ005 TaxID=2652443 RepID=UPI00125CBAA1|nr:LacI family DNA-binding transcriptional regulator [Deinococcus sp. AJ005]QFP75278.1 LacI family transcriptional regulator [Deinococcus sp. AJ005]
MTNSPMRPSIKDVARLSGVSIGTVSKCLSNATDVSQATRERVMKVADHIQYRPMALARGLARGRSGNIAVTLSAIHTPVFLDPFYAEVLGGIETELEARGLHLLLTSLKSGQDLLQLASERRADGLIMIGFEVTDSVLQKIAQMQPLVLVDRHVAGISSVMSDNREGTRQGTRRLIELGRRRLLFISERANVDNMQARLSGFRQALAEAQLDPQAIIVCDEDNALPLESVLSSIKQKSIDAVVCGNDHVAYKLLAALNRAGMRVPEQVAVLGYDGLRYPLEGLRRLSSVRVDKGAMGAAGARLLLDKIAQPGSPVRQEIISTTFQQGSTTPEPIR